MGSRAVRSGPRALLVGLAAIALLAPAAPAVASTYGAAAEGSQYGHLPRDVGHRAVGLAGTPGRRHRRLRAVRPARRLPGRPEPEHLPTAPGRSHRGRPAHHEEPAGRHRAGPGRHRARFAGRRGRLGRQRCRAGPHDRRQRDLHGCDAGHHRAQRPYGRAHLCCRPAYRRGRHGVTEQHHRDEQRVDLRHSLLDERHDVRRSGLRRVHGAGAVDDGHVVRGVAVQVGQHVHRRREPRLSAAEPDGRLGHANGRPGLDADPDVCGSAGALRQQHSHHRSHRPCAGAGTGQRAADDAIAQLNALGLGIGNPVYFDMEGYPVGMRTRRATPRFLPSRMPGRRGCMPAATCPVCTAALARPSRTLVAQQSNPAFHQPDDIWFARWKRQGHQPGDPLIPDSCRGPTISASTSIAAVTTRPRAARPQHRQRPVDAAVAPSQLAAEGSFVTITGQGGTYRIAGGARSP